MDSDKKEGWNNAKIKFDKIFAKLRTQIEKEKISTIKQTIGLVKEYYEALDEAQTSYVKILMNDGKSEDIKRLNTELAEIETDMEETIALANNIMSKKSEENVAEKKEDKKEETTVEYNQSKGVEISSTKGRPVMDSDEEEDQYNEAKEKFEKLFAKLEKQTKKQQTSTLSKTIQNIKEAWVDLEKSQSNYVKRLRKAGNKEDASRVNKENVDLEADMDEQIFLAEEILSGHAKVEPEKRKLTRVMQEEEDYNEAKDKFENLFAKLKRQTLKEQTSNLNRTLDDIKKAFMDLEKSQINYTIQLRKIGKKDEASKISKETASFEVDMEQQISLAEKVLSEDKGQVEIVEIEADTDDEIEDELLSEDQEPKKIKSKGVIQKVQEGVQQIKEGVENVGQNIANTLSKILVSKKQFEDFQIQLKDALVSEWDETAESKVFQGVQVSRYADFLKLFKKSTKVDDEILAEFETMEFTDRMDDKVKTFTCQGTDTGGKYGLYMAVKRPGEDKIDVAYAMYTYKAKFVGSSKAKPNQYKIWRAESAKDGLYRLTKPLVENILTGKMMEPDRFFRKADIDELAENFIVAKALQAFAHYGIIQKVSFVEDEDKNTRIEQQSKQMLEDKSR